MARRYKLVTRMDSVCFTFETHDKYPLKIEKLISELSTVIPISQSIYVLAFPVVF